MTGQSFRTPVRTRRALLGDMAKLLSLGAAAQLLPLSLPSSRAAAQSVPRLGPVTGPGQAGQAQERGARVVLLGTQGGPSVNLRRGQTASALVVDGRPYLIDCGYGTLRALVEGGIGYTTIGTVFLTHLHDDHTSDVAALLSLQWTGRRTEPTDLYGPYGTQALVAGALEFFKANTVIRTVDEGRTVKPESLFHGHDIAATSTPAKVFEDDRVHVTSIENTHFPERAKAKMPYRSLAYRVEAAGRSIVFAGDTAYSKNVVELARGADVFICEAMDTAQRDRLLELAQQAEKAHSANFAYLRHIVETHSTTEQVGQMAAEAQVKTVVLNHLLPGSNGPLSRELPDTAYVAGVRKYFEGEVIVGRDQMRL